MAASAAPERIASRANRLLMRVRRIANEPAAYRQGGEIVLEGEHLCAAWAERGQARVAANVAIVSDFGWGLPAVRELASLATRTVLVDAQVMSGLSALESPPPILLVATLPAAAALAVNEPTLVLDAVQDPGNVGALLRSAAAFGVTQVMALPGTAALWSPKVLRAAMGAHFGLRLLEDAGIDALAALAVPLLGTSSHATANIDQGRLPWPCAWVFGNEGSGLSDAVRERCSDLLRIDQPGGQESLNVAAAAAVCLYESARQRRAA